MDNKRLTAIVRHIQVEYQIILPETYEKVSSELNSVFFNLLDNALESCSNSGIVNPFIRLNTRTAQDFLVIHMINSKSSDVKFSHKTSKSDAISHGFGLSIIEEIAQKYDGSCQWDDHGNTFESTILLRI